MIGGTCMCLSFVLLVNKSHYWLGEKGKMLTFFVKPSLIIQEVESVTETPFLYVLRNDSVIKTLSGLYLVTIFVCIYVYICVHMCF